ncbi:MAG: RDD family protein [Myxococcota bacterium]
MNAVGKCLSHVDRDGTPCTRCGTFRCGECLVGGLCPQCSEGRVARAPQVEDVEGFGRRAGGRIIDVVVSQGAGLMAGVIAGLVLAILEAAGLARAGWLERFDHGFGFNFLSGTSASVLGAAVSTWLGGATVGKALLGMRVIRTDGQRAGLGANLLRELVYLFDALFFGLVGKAAMDSSPLQQRHGDRVANTTVVRAAALGGAAAYPMPRLMLGLAVGLMVNVAVLAAFFVVGGL